MDTKTSVVPPKETVRCAIYARICTRLAGQSSAAEQIALCRNAALKAGWTVVEDCVRVDVGRSGITMDGRRGLQELMALAGTKPRPFDTLICESTNRLSRDLGITVPILDALNNDGVNIYFAALNLGTADPHFREIFCLCSQMDYLLGYGPRIRKGVQPSKLAKVKKTPSAAATA